MAEREVGKIDKIRYARHLKLAGWGERAQARLARAEAMIVGLGGLGSAAALYLAAAGVGSLHLVDDQRVELSNLQRQILYGEADLGTLKTDAARRRLEALNTSLEIRTTAVTFTRNAAADFARGQRYILDCSDNYATRMEINAWCVAHQAVHVFGSVRQYAGQLAVFDATQGPCWSCIFGGRQAQERAADRAVLASLPGVIGALMAQETLKMLSGTGQPPWGKMIFVEGQRSEFTEIELRKRNTCPVCSQQG